MQCQRCYDYKLSNEFPRGRTSDACAHAPSLCLRCILGTNNTGGKSCPECKSPLSEQALAKLKAQLALASPAEFDTTASIIEESLYISFTVALMGGENEKFNDIPSSTPVYEFQKLVQASFLIPPNQQRLVFNGKKIVAYEKGQPTTLRYYGVSNGSSLQLMQVLLSIEKGSGLNRIDFVLRWEWPPSTTHAYLDASCLTYRFCTLNVQLCDTSKLTVQFGATARKKLGHSVIICCLARTEAGGWDVPACGKGTYGGNVYDYEPVKKAIASLFRAGSLDLA